MANAHDKQKARTDIIAHLEERRKRLDLSVERFVVLELGGVISNTAYRRWLRLGKMSRALEVLMRQYLKQVE